MQVRYAILCDFSNESADGKLNLVGTTDVIFATSFPCVHKSCHFVVSFVNQPDDFGTKKHILTELIDEDGHEILRAETQIEIPAGQLNMNHRHIIYDLQFARPGPYQFTVRIDGAMAYSTPFFVQLLPGNS